VTLLPNWLRSSFTQFFTLTNELLSVMSYTNSAPAQVQKPPPPPPTRQEDVDVAEGRAGTFMYVNVDG
jgi:hypothetical protein